MSQIGQTYFKNLARFLTMQNQVSKKNKNESTGYYMIGTSVMKKLMASLYNFEL